MNTVLWIVLGLALPTYFAGELVLRYRRRERNSPTNIEWPSFFAVFGSIALGLITAVVARLLIGPADVRVERWYLLAALPFVWGGIGFRLWAVYTLGRYFRLVVHVQAQHRVVDSGPYRWVRHPSYAGGLAGLLGAGLTFANPVSVVACLVLPLCGMLYRIRSEEEVLLREIGEPYRAYAQSKARLVPHVW